MLNNMDNMRRYVFQNCDYRATARRLRLLPPEARPALCLTSPPYDDDGNGARLRDYGGDYDYRFKEAIPCIYETLRPGGILAWNEGFSFRDNRQGLDPFRHVCEFVRYGFEVLQVIVVYKTSGGEPVPKDPRRFLNSYELAVIAYKPGPGCVPYFNPLKDRRNRTKRSRSGGKKINAAGKRTRHRSGPCGHKKRNLRHSVWQYATGLGNHTRFRERWLHSHRFTLDGDAGLFGAEPGREVEGAPALMHWRLARDLIRAYCPPGGLVWDPFAGACTVLAEGLRRGHRVVGSEVCGAYCRELGHPRLLAAIRGE
jgi:DNA modification methylase